jgi:hypothetical protein
MNGRTGGTMDEVLSPTVLFVLVDSEEARMEKEFSLHSKRMNENTHGHHPERT